MGDKRICISKQLTFIALVVLLLLGYIVFAYGTMTNKTSTNSRAYEIKESTVKTSLIAPPPTDMQIANGYIFKTALGSGLNTQITGKYNKEIPAGKRYSVYLINGTKKIHLKTGYSNGQTLKTLTSTYWKSASNITPNDISKTAYTVVFETN